MERQLREQQQQLEQLKNLMRLRAQQEAAGGGLSGAPTVGGLPSADGTVPSVIFGITRGPGSGSAGMPVIGGGLGLSAPGTGGQADKVSDAFASLDLAGEGKKGGGLVPSGQLNGPGARLMTSSSVQPQLGGGVGVGVMGAQGAGVRLPGGSVNRQPSGVVGNGVGGMLALGPNGIAGVRVAGAGGGERVHTASGGLLEAGGSVASLGMGTGQRGQMPVHGQQLQQPQMGGSVLSQGMMEVGAGGITGTAVRNAGGTDKGIPAQGTQSKLLGCLSQLQGHGQGYGSRMGGDSFRQPNSSGGGSGL